MANSDWSINKLSSRRANKIKKELAGNAITVVIDETGDRKKGKKSDYVAREYLGSGGKVETGIVSVNAYGGDKDILLQLSVKVFQPKGRLKAEDKYKTKIEIATEIITELMDEGFNIELVLADSLSGEQVCRTEASVPATLRESSQFIEKLTE
jgi:SRSO17 transposase